MSNRTTIDDDGDDDAKHCVVYWQRDLVSRCVFADETNLMKNQKVFAGKTDHFWLRFLRGAAMRKITSFHSQLQLQFNVLQLTNDTFPFFLTFFLLSCFIHSLHSQLVVRCVCTKRNRVCISFPLGTRCVLRWYCCCSFRIIYSTVQRFVLHFYFFSSFVR